MKTSRFTTLSAGSRLGITAIIGLLVGVGLVSLGFKALAPLAAWDTTGLLFVAWTMLVVLPFGATETRKHVARESSSRPVTDVVLVLAALASLIGVLFLILQASNASGAKKSVEVALGLLSVVVSWGIVHTTYLLRYARLYYSSTEGGISFNEQSPPRYLDFAYLAFTIGMTFQVSDTNLQSKEIRATALKHALLSYLFGTVIIATTINTLASLTK